MEAGEKRCNCCGAWRVGGAKSGMRVGSVLAARTRRALACILNGKQQQVNFSRPRLVHMHETG
eukprot:6001810-Pleurochrysis_carterae.AAC.1